MKAPRGFAYALDPLWRQRGMERDAARTVLLAAEAAVRTAKDRLEHLEVRFAAARNDWNRRQQGLSLQWQRVASVYLRDLGAMIREQQGEIRRLEDERDEAARLAVEAHRALEVVEKHREEAIAQHEREQARKALALADEAWVQRAPHKEQVA